MKSNSKLENTGKNSPLRKLKNKQDKMTVVNCPVVFPKMKTGPLVVIEGQSIAEF